MTPRVLAVILAGGEGKRLYPLTLHRAKPSVPFGGRYRLIDFALNNFINSGFYKIKVLTQYKSDSLNTHLLKGWRLSPILDQYIEPVPAQMRKGPHWYRGTADAVFQNINIIFDEKCDYCCIFGGDHVYKMDIRQMLDFHIQTKADFTIAAVPMPVESATSFGVLQVREDWKIIDFKEKPHTPACLPHDSAKALVSMGNYIFNTNLLVQILEEYSVLKDSSHDFGKDIIPEIHKKYSGYAYNFNTNIIPGATENERGYWRDVGTITAYWQASMDLVSVSPVFNLYNQDWPLRSVYLPTPPAKFVFADVKRKRMGIATDSMVSEGCIISGGRINKTILFPNVRINSFSFVTESVIMEGVEIGRYAKIKKAIIDKGVKVPPGCTIGYDHEKDRKRGFHVSESGVVVVPREVVIEEKYG